MHDVLLSIFPPLQRNLKKKNHHLLFAPSPPSRVLVRHARVIVDVERERNTRDTTLYTFAARSRQSFEVTVSVSRAAGRGGDSPGSCTSSLLRAAFRSGHPSCRGLHSSHTFLFRGSTRLRSTRLAATRTLEVYETSRKCYP